MEPEKPDIPKYEGRRYFDVGRDDYPIRDPSFRRAPESGALRPDETPEAVFTMQKI